MKKIFDSFKERKFKYGGYATLMTTIVIVLVVIVNILVSQIPWKADLTQNKMYSLSEETQAIAKSINTPISIIGLYQVGKENAIYDEIIDKYTTLSKNIVKTYIDPIKNPTFSAQYTDEGETLATGSFIVQSEQKYRVIKPEDILNYSMNQYGQYNVDSISLEQQLTSALKYVTSEKLPIAYTLTGHGEEPLAASLQSSLELGNYEVKSLSFAEQNGVPEDCDVLIINAPTVDLNDKEVAMMEAYFEDYGSALFMMGFVNEPMPGFAEVLEVYGLEIEQCLIVEGNQNNYFQDPSLVIPNYEAHAITDPLSKQDLRLTALGSQNVKILDLLRDELTVEPLLTTSDNSWAKIDLTNVKTADKEPNDLEGPFNLAVAVTDNKYWDTSEGKYYTAKIVVIGNANFLKPEYYAAEPNADFVMNAITWLNGEEDSIYISAKDLSTMPLQMNALQVYAYSALTVIVIPLIILIIGLIVWLKRRHL